ncbi:MAG: hypothetical protein M3O71_02560 [Bacteroidota bacterium]|nr:hypothetical protein [Bacteroidota bacterium]
MKTIFTLILIYCSISLKAQDSTFTKMDAKMYGTALEKSQQLAIENKSQSRFLCRFIGFKQYYIGELETYIQSNMGFNADDKSPYKPGYLIDVYTKKGVFTGVNPPKLKVTFSVDKDDRVKSVIIDSRFEYLAHLFISYWPQSADLMSEVQLKPGIIAQKHSFGDLITFNWNGNAPYIKITKDVNMSFTPPVIGK